MNYRQILVVLLIFFFSCNKTVKNRVRIVGGNIRLLGVEELDSSGVVNFYPYNPNCSKLAVGVLFDIEFYEDGSEETGLFSFHTEGLKGPEDSIEIIRFKLGQKDISSCLKGYPTNTLNFSMSVDVLETNRDYLLSSTIDTLYSTFSFLNLNSFAFQYNSRVNELVSRNNLNREVFYFVSDSCLIQNEVLDSLSLEITLFNNNIGEKRQIKLLSAQTDKIDFDSKE